MTFDSQLRLKYTIIEVSSEGDNRIVGSKLKTQYADILKWPIFFEWYKKNQMAITFFVVNKF